MGLQLEMADITCGGGGGRGSIPLSLGCGECVCKDIRRKCAHPHDSYKQTWGYGHLPIWYRYMTVSYIADIPMGQSHDCHMNAYNRQHDSHMHTCNSHMIDSHMHTCNSHMIVTCTLGTVTGIPLGQMTITHHAGYMYLHCRTCKHGTVT